MKKILFFAGALMMFPLCTIAQKSPVYELYKQKYPDAHAVRLLEERKIDISLEDNEILITQDIFEEDLYLDKAATYGSKRSINYSSFFDIESVEASSLLYENGKYNELEVKDFVEKDEMDQSFYDDSKSINFIYPSLQPGAKSKLKYRERIKNPRFLNSFYFADFKPIVKSKVTISVDKNISLKFKEFNTEGVNINFTEKEKRGKRIYTWEANDIEEYDLDSGAPNFRNTFPHIIPIITEYKSGNDNVKLLDNVSDLYGWYYSLVKDVNTEEADEELKKIVNILTQNKKTNLEKVKAIYYWVQENIKYIAFEYALGGFIPREANDVFNKKYGDCKDNSSILFKMLDIAGLKGNLTWIGTRSIPYKYDEVPTPAVDNHMILTYLEGDNAYFLDATGRYIPIDMPSSFIQGKEALISINEKDFVIKEVPVIDAKRNSIIDSTVIKIEDKIIKGKGKFRLSGYPKIDFYNALEIEKSEKGLKDVYTKELRKGSNKFLVDEFKEINKYDYDKDFIVEYTYNIDDYVNSLEDETFINLNLNRRISGLKSKKDRKNDREYRYKLNEKCKIILEIPDSMVAAYVPENFSTSNDFFSCSIKYTQEENRIVYEMDIDQNFILLTLDQQKELNKLVKKVEKNFKEVIILKDKK
ncbi:DUF3857 domain-containing protein [Aquimarina gracilis]|uniref:DUF3857 domain-containing protein n=1 Tax=Aquimarina gracilis TaxID=874422 RepID=A0ABU5ZYX9_9FLAO|nr:DUF3857 domain-containing protein [Aquimarina gracilis]MEB3347084.1 DUF3857 domain-containing protein [Aquimarina gracilis]